MADGEDEETIAAHIAGMCKELRKPSPGHEYLCDSMRRTFAEPRGLIATRIPSVKDVLEKYPALSTSAVVHLDFQLERNAQLQETLEKDFQHSCSKIIAAVQNKRHLNALNKEIVDSASEPSQSDDVMLSAAVCVLPSLVRKRMGAFICPNDPGAMYVFPTVAYTAGGSIFDATKFVVQLEDVAIPESTFLAAAASLIALYRAFDVVFDLKAKKSLGLICRAVSVDSGVSPTPLV